MASKQPSIILDYQIGSLLGRGGYGAVYKGVNVQTGDFVAIKQINLSAIPKDQIGGIMMEIDLLKKLKHDNIVKYIGYKKTKDFLNIILEFVENGSLASIVKSFGRFPESLVRVYISQVLNGLLYLHEQGVVHRDIKGANILATKKGHVKLADFGVAVDKLAAAEDTSEVVGTPYWMAPEIIELAGASSRSDIWSVGCTVIELLTGDPPYFDLAPMPALFRIVQDDHPPIPADISSALKDFLMECFQKDPLLRIDAAGLLKHPWVKSKCSVPAPIAADFEEVQENIKRHNEELKATDSAYGTIRYYTITKPLLKGKIENEEQTEKTEKTDKNKVKELGSKNQKAIEMEKEKEREKERQRELEKEKERKAKEKEQKKQNNTEESWDDLEPVTPVKQTKSLRRSSMKSKPIKISKPAEEDWEGSWDDEPVIPVNPKSSPSTSSSLKKKSKSLNHQKQKQVSKPKITSKPVVVDDDDDWDDIELPNDPPKPKPTPVKSTPPKSASKKPVVVDDDDWDDIELPTDVPKKPAAPAKSSLVDDEEDWDDMDLDTPIVAEKKTTSSDPDDFDDFSLGGGFDFAAKLQKLNEASETEDEDGFDNIFDAEDFEVGRDNFMALSNEVSRLLGCLTPKNNYNTIKNAAEELIALFQDNPDEKSRLIRHFGVIQILEILESTNTDMLDIIIRLINQIVENNNEIQENFCLVGGIPAILHFADGIYSKEIRLEVAKFVKLVCAGSKLTHQMFIACRGLPSLVGFLATNNYLSDKDLVFMAIDGIQSVFELQSSTPKNDFCRLFVKHDALKFLSTALLNIIRDSDENSEPFLKKILDILLNFSSGDSVVKSKMADDSPGGVLGVLFTCVDLLKNASSPNNLITLVKSIKQLSTDSATYTPLQNVGAIPRLVALFNAPCTVGKDLVNQLISSLYNLTRIDRARQEQAARAGIIPHLKDLINNNSPLKQFAMEIILDIGRTPGGRAELWKHDGVEYYLHLLSEANWRVSALEVLSYWLADERKVQNVICQSNNIVKLINVFVMTTGPMFVRLVAPFLRVVQSSQVITRCISQDDELVNTLLDNVQQTSHDPNVRVNLMRILIALHDQHPNSAQMVDKYCLDLVMETLKEDRVLFVQELANQLSNSFSE